MKKIAWLNYGKRVIPNTVVKQVLEKIGIEEFEITRVRIPNKKEIFNTIESIRLYSETFGISAIGGRLRDEVWETLKELPLPYLVFRYDYYKNSLEFGNYVPVKENEDRVG
jgi:hypothetical protein